MNVNYEIVRGFIESPVFTKKKENLSMSERNEIRKKLQHVEKELFGGNKV